MLILVLFVDFMHLILLRPMELIMKIFVLLNSCLDVDSFIAGYILFSSFFLSEIFQVRPESYILICGNVMQDELDPIQAWPKFNVAWVHFVIRFGKIAATGCS
eukprot:TRINITY_DN36606_c0_g1_i1.p2 TRINITY_DN36606_c0_g1~~TRINITY_DN36606_c0_g1_i1.p2  ORF type:complete len:103 (+),score=12.36 TRINITY_DN36606_c0_g1_i1:362-670(+)